jgi:electron transfer flavoprotein alpha subunit
VIFFLQQQTVLFSTTCSSSFRSRLCFKCSRIAIESTSPFQVKRNAFSNKAFNITEISTDVKVLGIAKNSFGLVERFGFNDRRFFAHLNDADFGIKVENVEKVTGKVTIADAEVVVSAGRGLKGPENWGMIEELATVLGAATACSKPVSDLDGDLTASTLDKPENQ